MPIPIIGGNGIDIGGGEEDIGKEGGDHSGKAA